MKPPIHTMIEHCEYCGSAHRGESQYTLAAAADDLRCQIAACRRLNTPASQHPQLTVRNYNDNFITI